MHSESERSSTLEYGNRPPLAWVGRHRRKLILLALLGAILGPIIWYWPQLKHRVLWMYWVHKASQHPVAAGLPMVVSEAMFTPELEASPDFFELPAGRPGRRVLIRTPHPVRELARLDPRLQPLERTGIAFVGTLHRPDGTPRLVIVNNSSSGGSYRVDSSGRISEVIPPNPTAPNFIVLPIPGLFDRPPPTIAAVGGPQFLGGVLTGSIDPNDPSHLIFSLDTPQQGTLHLYLQNDDSFRYEQDVIPTPDQMIRRKNTGEMH